MPVDIRVSSVPLGRKVWRLFPGEGYSFLETSKQEQVGFLDFPGSLLPEKRPTAPNIVASEIKRSIALREAIYENGRDVVVDPRDLDISKYRSSDKRTRDENAILNFYYEASVGDIVVLPEPKRASRIWLGQIESHRIVGVRTPKRYGNYLIPARNIRWLKSVTENSISTALSMSLRNPHAFGPIEKSLYYEVFALTFSSYIFGDRRAATIFNSDEFLDADSSLIANLTKITAAACQIIDSDEEMSEADSRNILSILLTNPPVEYSCTQESDIHSRGFTRLTSGTDIPIVTSAVLAALMLLSGCSTKDDVKTKVREIEYVNSSTSSDPACNARVSKAAKISLEFMDTETTWKLCEAARDAEKRKIKPSARPIVKQ